MDTATITAFITPKRRAQAPTAADGAVDYVGRHVRPAPAPRTTVDHPRAHGFSILSRLARANDLAAAAV